MHMSFKKKILQGVRWALALVKTNLPIYIYISLKVKKSNESSRYILDRHYAESRHIGSSEHITLHASSFARMLKKKSFDFCRTFCVSSKKKEEEEENLKALTYNLQITFQVLTATTTNT